ncbi:MAG: system killer suppression protein [Micavibrio sp.]|nr:system killer suppression protein [Micavibrio sp.]
MDVQFKKNKMQKTCESEKRLIKTFGQSRARKIQRRLTVLRDADCLEQISHKPPERRHQLSGNRDEEFTVDIEDQWRIIFKPNHNEIPRKEDGGIDISKVTAISIIDICEDTHQ